MPSASQTPSERFVQLDALRFLFAVIVVFLHTAPEPIRPAQGGYAVDFFFILSGFVLSHALINRPVSLTEFGWARLARLYPLHLLTLAWLVWIVGRPLPVAGLGLNLALLHGAWADVPPWNFPSWSISVEFLVNLLLLYPIVRMRSIRLAAGLVLMSWVVVVATRGPVFGGYTVQPVEGTHLAGGFLRGVGGILLGYLLYEGYLRLRPRLVPTKRTAWLAGGFELTGLAVLAWCVCAGGHGWDLVPAPLSALLIFQFALSPGPIGHLLQGQLFATLGNISYSIYLIHIPVFATFESTSLAELGGPGPAFMPMRFALYLGLVLGLSVASYRYVEKPAQLGLMRLFRRWRIARTALP